MSLSADAADKVLTYVRHRQGWAPPRNAVMRCIRRFHLCKPPQCIYHGLLSISRPLLSCVSQESASRYKYGKQRMCEQPISTLYTVAMCMKLSFDLFQILYKGDLLEWLLLPMVLRCGVNEAALTPPFRKSVRKTFDPL